VAVRGVRVQSLEVANGACGGCGAPEVPGNRFCGACGRPYAVTSCASCGLAVPSGFAFCGACGTPVAVGADRSTAFVTADERKLATIVFADVVGFTTLAERSDPEVIARSIDHAFRRLNGVVLDHGGTVDKYLGDGLMAVFGVPTSRDDDAERAVACAIEIANTTEGDLAFSVGVNTGEVMVTTVGRDGDVTVIGDAVNVAARLEKVARPGQVVVGPMTAELCGPRVLLERRAPIAVKGRVTPVQVYEAVGLATNPQQAANAWPLIGRDAELAFLCSTWERVVQNRRPSVVLLTGAAGVGKTRLADELIARIGCESALVVRASYPAYGGLGGPRVGAEVARQLGPTGDPEIDSRLKSAAGEMAPGLGSLEAGALFAEQVWAYRQLVEIRANEQPLLVVIDDAHRSNDRLLDLVNEIHARMDDVPALTLLVGRPEPPSWLAAMPRASSLRLDPLGAADAAVFASHLAPSLDAAAIAEVVDRAAGNPLFVRELALLAARAAQVPLPGDPEQERAANASEARNAVPGVPPSLPPTLQAILAARLDALAPGAKLALQHVAVLGGGVTVDQVAALGGGAENHVPQMLNDGLLRASGPGLTQLSLADSLLAEVAYEMLPRHLRADRHRIAAANASTLVERARHLGKAARHEPDDGALRTEAAAAMEAAGREALAERRIPETIRLLGGAVDLGSRDPALILDLAQMRADQLDTDGVVELLHLLPEELEPAHSAHRVHVAALATVSVDPRHAIEMFEEATRQWAAVERHDKVAWAHANMGLALLSVGKVDAAGDAFIAAADGFERVDDDHGRSAVYRMLHLVRPEDERVPMWLGALRDRAERSGDRTSRVFALSGLLWWSFLRTRLGDPAELAVIEADALALADAAQALGQEGEEIQGISLAIVCARQAGRLETAQRHAARLSALDVCSAAGEGALGTIALWLARLVEDPALPLPPLTMLGKDPLSSAAIILMVEGLVLAGRADEALALKGLEDEQPKLGPLGEIVGSAALGWAAVWAGDHAQARHHLDVISRLAGPVGWHAGMVLGAGLRAEVAAADGDRGAGRAALDDLPADRPGGGVAAAVALRGAARLGDEAAAARLPEVAAELAAPGLLT
jgi:class 3 adenylate cyclase/tetratricopeptide (TPR) repeat protein